MKEINPKLPINRQAANVVSKSHDHWGKWNNGTNVISKIPLPTISLSALRSKKIDLTGREFGRLTVIGVFAPYAKSRVARGKSLRWVVRCSCGYYEVRKEDTIKKSKGNDMCNECKEKRYLSRHANYLSSVKND